MDTENLIKKVHEKQINVLSEQVRQLLNMVVNLQNENVRLRKEIDKSSLMGKKCRTKKSKSKHC